MQKKIENIVNNLKQFAYVNGFKKAVIGLSGGIDSALTAKLGVMAFGAENVFAIIMPHKSVSAPQNTIDAEDFSVKLGIPYKIIPIKDFETPFETLHWGHRGIAQMNIKARIRANILYHYANTHGAIVLGTGNKTEEMLGYFTKFGDGACDILPIGSLYKTQVWEVSRILQLPEVIINKTTTAELKDGQTDEAEIGMSYTEIDRILMKFESGGNADNDNEKIIAERIKKNRHKSEVPPVINY